MKRRKASSFFIGACALVAAGLVLAFLAIGTPAHNREIELDNKRTVALDEMAISIRARYHDRGRLPETLSADYESNAYVSNRFDDPESGRRYEYRRIDEHRFRLCAKFSAPSDPDVEVHPRVYQSDWPHPAGVFCKEYSIDYVSGGMNV